MPVTQNFGAFVVSLDFELYWGVRDYILSNREYENNLVGEYEAIPAILRLFEEFGISATWATVGFLFADSAQELKEFTPKVLPQYDDPALSPYTETFEKTPIQLSVHYAPELIDLIKKSPGQEIGTHTFSHYYCLEKGQTAESFASDIESSVAIARAKGIKLRSIVFPRNQHNPHYDGILLDHGIVCYRGNQGSWMYQFDGRTQTNPLYRVARLADTYLNVSGLNTFGWDDIWQEKIANVRASMFLRPVTRGDGFGQSFQYRRITKSLEYAARNGQIFHLWWHPHNFGSNLKPNIDLLRRILERFSELRDQYQMRSLTMTETAETALAASRSSRG